MEAIHWAENLDVDDGRDILEWSRWPRSTCKRKETSKKRGGDEMSDAVIYGEQIRGESIIC